MIEDTSAFAGVIYGLHNGDFNYRYIGKTTTPLRNRIYQHKHSARKGSPFAVHNWMRKYGLENVQVCVIATFDQETIHLIDEVEQFHIAQCRSLIDEKNLNLTDGGDGGAMDELCKEKLRQAHLGKVLTPEHKAKLSVAHSGKTLSAEHRQSISKSNLGNKNAARSAHIRWHEKRNVVSASCKHCPTSEEAA
jgi:hypothetical protein